MNERTEKRPQRFPSYSKYRDSGVEWLGEVPVHWVLSRLRYVVGTSISKNEVRHLDPETEVSFVPMEAVQEYGGIDLDSRKPLSEVIEGYTYFRDGDVIVAKITPCFENGKGALATDLCSTIGFGTTELHVLRPSHHVTPRFLLYLTYSDHFRRIGAASMYGAGGQKRISDEFIRNFRHPMPSLSEQLIVAEYLDRETARIDALVAKKERLIELLQEKRTALIARAIARGLDPGVPMKDSGVESLGEIPKHWESGALSLWWTVLDCKHRTVPFLDEGIAVASIGEVHGLQVDLSNAKRTSIEHYQRMIEGGRAPQIGDIIYSRNATVGEAAIVDNDEPFCMGQDVSLIRSVSDHPLFLLHTLRSRVVLAQLEAHIVGSTFKRINVAQIKKLFVPVPPIPEQEHIAQYVQHIYDTTSSLIEKVRHAMDRLAEFRTALISAAVTGKIDIRKEAS